jgi:hypothetical protein
MRATVLAGLIILLATSLAAWGQGGQPAGEAQMMPEAAMLQPEDVPPPKKPFPFVPVAIVIAVVAGAAALVMKKKK